MVFPKGVSASPANLKCCNPNGMPIIVMQHKTPKRRCVSAIQMPPIIIHKMFRKRLSPPELCGLGVTFEPKGHRARTPSL